MCGFNYDLYSGILTLQQWAVCCCTLLLLYLYDAVDGEYRPLKRYLATIYMGQTILVQDTTITLYTSRAKYHTIGNLNALINVISKTTTE